VSAVSIDELRSLLDYDPATGELVWKPRDPALFKNGVRYQSWNTRFAGKQAGSVNKVSGYRLVAVVGSYLYAHRIAYALHHGEWPEVIDHANGDRLDNRIENLSSVSAAENMRNIKIPSHNTSGSIGVYWDKVNSKWCSQIIVGGIKKNLGRFSSYDDAVQARKDANASYDFHANHGRGAA